MDKSVTLRFRCSPEDAEKIKELAGENFSKWCRDTLLGGAAPKVRTWGGKPAAQPERPSSWKDLLPPT